MVAEERQVIAGLHQFDKAQANATIAQVIEPCGQLFVVDVTQ
jgi:hypothetical protein